MAETDGRMTKNEQELTHMWEHQAVLLIGRNNYNTPKNNSSICVVTIEICSHLFIINEIKQLVKRVALSKNWLRSYIV